MINDLVKFDKRFPPSKIWTTFYKVDYKDIFKNVKPINKNYSSLL